MLSLAAWSLGLPGARLGGGIVVPYACVMLFDTHAHLDQADFDEIRDAVIDRARAAGVTRMLAVGTTAAASRLCVEIADRYEGVYAAVGIHPNHTAASQPVDWQAVEEMATLPRVIAIGETGLDRHWDETPFDQQQEMFARHMDLAARVGKPFIVHMRECEDDIRTALQNEHARRGGQPLSGIMHSFTGDAALAAECVALGMHVSFAGMITYKKSQPLRNCAATIPAERLLIETDSPYLSPEPVRGKRPNEPAHMIHTAECVASARGMSLDELAALTTANARSLFNV